MDSDELPLSRSTTDRDALRRTSPEDFLADPALRIVHVAGGQLVMDGEDLLLDPPPVDVGAALQGSTWAYLGRDHHGPVIAIIHDESDDEREWSDLRMIGAFLPAREAGLATAAVALANWHRSHLYCSRCGGLTRVVESGWVRECERDGWHHFPRTDSAVIMAIIDSFDRILLAHNVAWPENRFSVPAGYVEPGEPLEAAVRREVWEETRIRVGRVVYQGSQPWPFPASLMVGFRGEALTNEPIPDGVEIAEARFFSRSELKQAVADGSVLLPGKTSIARTLIEDWYGQPL